ncbi:aminoacyl-tRNA hydrolase [Mycoplasma suis]|nr:aminoacyl-tRNA hydrolase [Mycoplasma suis]CBZ40365.1 Peptidyl-tRNA hydrolase (PTH) [Mycoplasma suis KI3806]
MKVIIALGNPGKEYENTRHNVGFHILDKFHSLHNCSPFENFLGSQISKGNFLNGNKFILCKPYEFMNNSGKTFIKLFHFLKLDINNVLLIYDELDVPLGSYTLTKRKEKKISHNGVRDLENFFPLDSILKIKVGIRPQSGKNLIIKDFVMDKFSPEEEKQISSLEKNFFSIIEKFISLNEKEIQNPINYIKR